MSELQIKSEVENQSLPRPVFTGQDHDIAEIFLANLDSAIRDKPITEAEARKVLWMIDLVILPLLVGSVVLSAMDKNIISNAALFGVLTDTHLAGNDFSWAGSIFFFGYLVFEWPMAYLLQRLPVAKLFGAMIFGWGVLAMCTAATSSFAGIATVRFLSKSASFILTIHSYYSLRMLKRV